MAGGDGLVLTGSAERFARLAGQAPYLAAAFLPALTPTRALLLGWTLEAGRPGPAGAAATLRFGLRHAAPWLLLHALRADAPAWAGLGFLLALTLARPAWAAARRGSWVAVALAAALFLPAVLGFLLQFRDGGPASGVAAWDAWRWAGESALPAEPAARPPLPDGSYSGLEYRLPPRLWPYPLEDSPQRGRALLLVLVLFFWEVGSVWVARVRRGLILQAGALAAAGLAAFSLAGPQALVVCFATGPSGPAEPSKLLLEVYGQGGDLWDPREGELLPPGGAPAFQVRRGTEPGRLRVVSAAPWAVVRPDSDWSAPEAPAAWLEVHPLRAPRSGGPEAADGGLGVLRLWAAGETGTGGGARWELDEEGVLYRRPLP